jgi:hypothetical protein
VRASCRRRPRRIRPAAGGDDAELAKKLSNPISDLVSVPFQFNWEQNVGPDNQTRFILKVQPVMPFAVTPKLNLIARVIVPFVSQPPWFQAGRRQAASATSDVVLLLAEHREFLHLGCRTADQPALDDGALGTEKWSLDVNQATLGSFAMFYPDASDPIRPSIETSDSNDESFANAQPLASRPTLGKPARPIRNLAMRPYSEHA